MTSLPRHKPDPIPAIHPLPEFAATGARKAVYEDTKAALGVPWMGVVTMAFSHYPAFYAALWSAVGPLVRTAEFGAACRDLRAVAEAQADGLDIADLGPALRSKGYSARELDDVRASIEVFSAGNMPYVLIASLARSLLAGGSLATGRPTVMESPPPVAARLVLLERHHADAPTVAIYDDIQATLGLPFVNTDYRALARWPTYFATAWTDLKTAIVAPGYEARVAAVHDEAMRLVGALPDVGGLRPETLQAAARADAPDETVVATVELFQWLLPGLVVNVAGLRRQLQESSAGPMD